MKYYSTQRPLTPGSFPTPAINPVLDIVNFDQKTFCEEIGRDAWGYVEYTRPLDLDIADGYDLIPLVIQVKKVRFVGVDSWRREVYEDESGKRWKYTDPGRIPREIHDRLYCFSDYDIDGEPCWPMRPDLDYEIVEEF